MKKILKVLIFIVLVGFGGLYISDYSWFLKGITKIYIGKKKLHSDEKIKYKYTLTNEL